MFNPFDWFRRFWYTDANFFSMLATMIAFVVTTPGMLTCYFASRYKHRHGKPISLRNLFGMHSLVHIALFFVIRYDGKHHLLLHHLGISLTPFALFIGLYYVFWVFATFYEAGRRSSW